jgi:REP element-mobilizing transposase RayT
MGRKLRAQQPAAVYHIVNRGDWREPNLKDNAVRQRFVERLAQACAKTGWQIHVGVRMPNHFHPVVRTPRLSRVPAPFLSSLSIW